MKYLAKSQNNKMIQLGEDLKRGKWYYVTEGVVGEIESLKIGDEITFVSEPRGGAFYVTFLAKGNVTPPAQETKPAEVIATQTPVTATVPPAAKPPFQKWTPSNKSDMSKADWEEKEHRDFKGRSVAYASSAMAHILPKDLPVTEEQYLAQLLSIAKKIEEYIYTK